MTSHMVNQVDFALPETKTAQFRPENQGFGRSNVLLELPMFRGYVRYNTPENQHDIGTSPCSTGNTSFKWWIFQPVMLVFVSFRECIQPSHYLQLERSSSWKAVSFHQVSIVAISGTAGTAPRILKSVVLLYC